MAKIGNHPIVIDIGTRLTMIGFAGEEQPRFSFPTVVGYDSLNALKDDTSTECYIGKEVLESMPLRLVYPFRAGFVEDWTAIEDIFTHTFELLEMNSSNSKLLMTKPDFNSQEYQRRATQILFHGFGVRHLTFVTRAALPMIALRKRTGFVIDYEPDYVSIMPVYNHLVIPHATVRIDQPTKKELDIPLIAKRIGIVLGKIDPDIRNKLCSNIVLIGSSTTTESFETVLLDELQRMEFNNLDFQIIAKPERLYLTWMGGSMFGRMKAFDELGMSRNEFQKIGFDDDCRE